MTDAPRYFEAVEVGEEYVLPETYEVTKAEIVEFAEQFDPQPFHVDEAAAAESMFGGLVASGWHTCSLAMRLLVRNYLNDSGAQGALGVDELRWHRPVRPGDSLQVRTEVVDTDSWSDDRGLVRSRLELYAAGEDTPAPVEDGDLAMSYVAQVLYDRAY